MRHWSPGHTSKKSEVRNWERVMSARPRQHRADSVDSWQARRNIGRYRDYEIIMFHMRPRPRLGGRWRHSRAASRGRQGRAGRAAWVGTAWFSTGEGETREDPTGRA